MPLKKLLLLLFLTGLWPVFFLPAGDTIAGPPDKSHQSRQNSQIDQHDTSPVPTSTWAMRLARGADPAAIAQSRGVEYIGPVGTLKGYHLFRVPAQKTRTFDPENMRSLPEVLWIEQQHKRKRFKRAPALPPNDPLFEEQWHLNNTGQSGGTPGMDGNLLPVWGMGIWGTGVQIAIVDDGLEHAHPDLTANYEPAHSWDFNGDDSDPSPIDTGDPDDPYNSGDSHGTSVAGVAAAKDDGVSCGVGAAFRARLSGLRLIADAVTDAQEAQALTYHYENNHIFNNSWGPSDDAQRLEGPGTLTQLALADGAENGRNGLGSIYVWAGGNGKSSDDNINYDGYANSRYTIAVGAVDHNGDQSYYSEPGAPMLITAPSSGSGAGISTTDLTEAGGYSEGNCTSAFGGTSSSSPLVSGIISLMLEARPDLTWRDVQHILIDSSVRNDPDKSDWIQNSAGRWVNHKYGFGMVDAEKAVNLALTWQSVNSALVYDSGPIASGQPIPDNDPAGVTASFFVPQNLNTEHVEVVFSATHTYRGDLEITITSPHGTKSVLAQKHPDGNENYPAWKFMSARHWGEPSKGLWTLHVADAWGADTGTLDSWQLIVYGTENPRPAAPFLPGVLMLLGNV